MVFDVLGFRILLHTRRGAEIRELLSTFRQVSEEEPERHDPHVESRWCNPGFRHVQLIRAQIFWCGRVG